MEIEFQGKAGSQQSNVLGILRNRVKIYLKIFRFQFSSDRTQPVENLDQILVSRYHLKTILVYITLHRSMKRMRTL